MGVSITVYDSDNISLLGEELERVWRSGEFPSGQILKLFFAFEDFDSFVKLLNIIFQTTAFEQFYHFLESGELSDARQLFKFFVLADDHSYPTDAKYLKFRQDYDLLTLLEVANPVVMIQ